LKKNNNTVKNAADLKRFELLSTSKIIDKGAMQELFDSSTHPDFNYKGRIKLNKMNGGLNIKKLTDVLTPIYKGARSTIATTRKKYKSRVTTLSEVTAELPASKGNNLKQPVETVSPIDIAKTINLLRTNVTKSKQELNNYLLSLQSV
jgi:hypothetical protein